MTLPVLPDALPLLSQYDNITPLLQEDVERTARNHLLKFQDSYFKTYLKKTDAKITTAMRFSKNKQEKYVGTFKFVLDGEEFFRSNEVPFKEPLDVVNHAFKHLKEYLANK